MNSKTMLTMGLCLIFSLGLFSALAFEKNASKKPSSSPKELAKEIVGEIGRSAS